MFARVPSLAANVCLLFFGQQEPGRLCKAEPSRGESAGRRACVSWPSDLVEGKH